MRFRWTNDLVMVVYGAEAGRESSGAAYAQDSFPPVDVIVSDNYVNIFVDLPGVGREDVYVYIQYDRLVIEGIKRVPCPPCDSKRFIRVERLYRPFKRTLQIQTPENPASIITDLKDGVLHIKWQK